MNKKIEKINKIKQSQALLKKLTDDVISEIAEEIKTTALGNGIRQLDDKTVIVPLSAMVNNIWTPEYYSPVLQADIVKQALNGAGDISAKITEMVKSGRVKIGPTAHPLNSNTISVLEKYI